MRGPTELFILVSSPPLGLYYVYKLHLPLLSFLAGISQHLLRTRAGCRARQKWAGTTARYHSEINGERAGPTARLEPVQLRDERKDSWSHLLAPLQFERVLIFLFSAFRVYVSCSGLCEFHFLSRAHVPNRRFTELSFWLHWDNNYFVQKHKHQWSTLMKHKEFFGVWQAYCCLGAGTTNT